MKVLAICLNTFREAVRDKILYSLLFFALMMIVLSAFLGELSLHQNERVIKNLGLFSISFFGVVIAIFVGVNLLYKEIEKKTIFTIVAKPIQRYQFVVGKYLGMLLTLMVQVVVMALTLLAVLHLHGVGLGIDMGKAFLLSYAELSLITAVALFFSAFSTPFLSGMLTFGVFVVGRLSAELVRVLPQIELVFIRRILETISQLLPDLWRFHVAGKVVHGAEVSWAYVGWTIGYGFFYSVVILIFASLLFSRRDFV